MKLTAKTADGELQIELENDGTSARALIDGREYHVSISEPEPGVYLLMHDSRVFEAAVSRTGKDEPLKVNIRGKVHEVEIVDPRRLRSTAAADAAADGTVEIKTAMPGKVVRVIAAEGDEVEKGQGVVVVEAMKMQNELRAPKTGVVRSIRVTEGQTVAAGDVLAVIS